MALCVLTQDSKTKEKEEKTKQRDCLRRLLYITIEIWVRWQNAVTVVVASVL